MISESSNILYHMTNYSIGRIPIVPGLEKYVISMIDDISQLIIKYGST